MVDKTTSFKKRAKGRRGTSRRTTSKLLLKWRSPSLVLSLRLSASTTKGLVTVSGTTPSDWQDKKDGKVNISIFDIHVIDVYFTSVYSKPSVFDASSVAKSSNSKRELQNEQRLVKGEVTMCVGSGSEIWYDHHRTLPILSGLVLNLNKCYLVFALSMNMIWSCLL